jgi:cytochrome c553
MKDATRMTLRNAAAPVALLLAALAFAGTASAGGPKGSAAAGKGKAVACAACHGADGNKTVDNNHPKLAGQYPDYVVKALAEYRSGKRKNAIMGAQAKGLSDKDIADLAAYYGSLRADVHDMSGHAE